MRPGLSLTGRVPGITDSLYVFGLNFPRSDVFLCGVVTTFRPPAERFIEINQCNTQQPSEGGTSRDSCFINE